MTERDYRRIRRIFLLRKARKFILRLTVYLIFVILCTAIIYNFQIYPYAAAIVEAKATGIVNYAVSDAVSSAVSRLGLSYSDFVLMNFDFNGRVSAFSVDTVKVNLLRTAILADVLASIGTDGIYTASIPLGTLLGGELTSGKGPELDVSVKVTDALSSSVTGSFEEAGINQTLHRVYLTLVVSVKALFPSGTVSFVTENRCCIGETVIVGDVPEAYTEINRLFDDISESEIDDIYDFGASRE